MKQKTKSEEPVKQEPANANQAASQKAKEKPKAKYIPFEQFVEENCIIRGQE